MDKSVPEEVDIKWDMEWLLSNHSRGGIGDADRTPIEMAGRGQVDRDTRLHQLKEVGGDGTDRVLVMPTRIRGLLTGSSIDPKGR